VDHIVKIIRIINRTRKLREGKIPEEKRLLKNPGITDY
jgi:hypothetical protein